MPNQAIGTLTPDRFVPANTEAEEAVLGSMIQDNSCIPAVRLILTEPEFFYNEKHAWIYKAICDLNDERVAVDYITLPDALDRRKQLNEVGGAAYIMDLQNAMPTSIHAEHYANIVKTTGVLRNIIRAAGQIAQVAYDENLPLDEVSAQVQSLIFHATKMSMVNRTVSSKDSMINVRRGHPARFFARIRRHIDRVQVTRHHARRWLAERRSNHSGRPAVHG